MNYIKPYILPLSFHKLKKCCQKINRKIRNKKHWHLAMMKVSTIFDVDKLCRKSKFTRVSTLSTTVILNDSKCALNVTDIMRSFHAKSNIQEPDSALPSSMSGEVINSALPVVERLQSGETAKKILGPASDERSRSGSGGRNADHNFPSPRWISLYEACREACCPKDTMLVRLQID